MNSEMWDQMRLLMSTPLGAQMLRKTMSEMLDGDGAPRRQEGGQSEKAIILARANKMKARQTSSATSALKETFSSILRPIASLWRRRAEMNQ
ncbi:MAG: hypothetical protein NTX50_11340 [Candidatus Sumerlaeota bacterium]|nr:hypothetical protein [Candidatus Sumerlaeota bacterium]